MKPKYDIGDELWHATFETRERKVTCPDCGGTGRIRVILHDDTEVSVDCAECARGFEAPSGRVTVYDATPEINKITIAGYEVRPEEGVEYRVRLSGSSYRIIKENDLSPSYEDAEKRADIRAEEYAKAQQEKFGKKEKNTRSWAWNASYHRRCIERAKKDIAYHERKLSVASLKAEKADVAKALKALADKEPTHD